MTYKVKLDDKIKALNSTRVFKKVTPKGGVSWYVKWVSCIFLLVAACFRAIGEFNTFDLCFSFLGVVGWLWVGILWHDRAIIMLNAALSTLLLVGILKAVI